LPFLSGWFGKQEVGGATKSPKRIAFVWAVSYNIYCRNLIGAAWMFI
jgi:hypothetical protein